MFKNTYIDAVFHADSESIIGFEKKCFESEKNVNNPLKTSKKFGFLKTFYLYEEKFGLFWANSVDVWYIEE